VVDLVADRRPATWRRSIAAAVDLVLQLLERTLATLDPRPAPADRTTRNEAEGKIPAAGIYRREHGTGSAQNMGISATFAAKSLIFEKTPSPNYSEISP
jgi:hypothetical protein